VGAFLWYRNNSIESIEYNLKYSLRKIIYLLLALDRVEHAAEALEDK